MTLYEKIISVVGMLRASISGKVSKTDFAPEFNPTAEYSVGRIVMHDDKLYECIRAHSGAWDPAHFSYTTMARVVEGKGGHQVQANWTEDNASSPSFILNKPDLADVATSGSYNDLKNRPDIRQADWDEDDANSPAYILNKPDIPTLSQEQSDWDEDDPDSPSYIWNKPDLRYAVLDVPETGRLGDRALYSLTLESRGATLVLPNPTEGRVADLFVDVVNEYSGAASISISGMGVDCEVVTRHNDNLSDVLALESEEMARLYFTLTALGINSRPTWMVSKIRLKQAETAQA